MQFHYARTPPETKPRYGGEVLRPTSYPGSTGKMDNWDYLVSGQTWLRGGGMCYGGFMKVENQPERGQYVQVPGPDLVQSWKQLDEVTWEFKLNPEVYWHDRPPANGRRVTAEDAVFNLNLLRDPAKSIHAAAFDMISSIEIKDPSTIVIKTTEPYAFLLQVLGDDGFAFSLPEMHQQPGGIKTWCIGFGPYKLVEYSATTGEMLLEAHPKFHGTFDGLKLPFIDKTRVISSADSTLFFTAMKTGKVHFATITGSPEESLLLLNTGPDLRAVLVNNGPTSQAHYAMRLDKPPFNDVRVRRAISMAINRQEISDTVHEGWVNPSHLIPYDKLGWETPPSAEFLGKYHQFNLEEAKRLMAEAGYSQGFTTTLDMQAARGPGLAEQEMIQFGLKKNLNIDLKFSILTEAAYRAKIPGKYEGMLHLGSLSSQTNIDTYTYVRLNSKSAVNFYFINDPELDRLTNLLRRTFDVVEQRKILLQIKAREDEMVYRIPLFGGSFNFQIAHKSLENTPSRPYGYLVAGGSREIYRMWFKP